MPHEECVEARRLLDAYLIALSNDDAAQLGGEAREITAQQAADVRNVLIAARGEYWDHVEWHGCRLADRSAKPVRSWIAGKSQPGRAKITRRGGWPSSFGTPPNAS